MTSNSFPQDTLALAGRVLVAWLFIPAGVGKIFGFSGIVAYIASHGIPLPEVCAAVSIAIELGLGLALLAGWQTRWVGLGLAIFVAVITPIFHNFWTLPEAQAMLQRQAFSKNVAVIGGLLVVAAFGAGRFSLDAWRASPMAGRGAPRLAR